MANRDPFESYLKKAAALFEGGDVVQAGQIWQAILKKSPDHSEARAGLYKVKLYFDARATQDGLASEQKKELAAHSAPVSAPAPSATAGGPAELVRLLEQGCTLYDAGHLEDAIAKWDQVLEKDPHNVLAKGYITGAQRNLGLPAKTEMGDGEPRSTSALPADLYLGTGAVAPPAPVEKAAPAPPPEPALDKDEIDRLLRDGCTLYDMGQPQDALKKWEQLLDFDPSHELARAYIKDARRDLGLDTLSDGAIPAPVELPPTGLQAPNPIPSPLPVDDQDRIDQLIREGTQLFDMGMAAEAIQKWEVVLALVPGHKDVEAYLAMARRETEAAPKPAAAVPLPTPAPRPNAMPKTDESEPNLRKGESLLHQGRFEEAAFLFQEVIKVSPQNFRALQGLHQAEALLQAREATHTAPPAQLYPPTPPLPGLELPAIPLSPLPEQGPGPESVEPPSALTTPAPPPRKGLELPELLRQMEGEIPAWLKRPRTIFAILGGIVLLNAGYMVFRWNRGESLLKQKTVSFREEALANVARNLEIANLEESPDAIRREAEGILGDDPLRAYYRGQELIRLNPLDGPAAQLMGRASNAMAMAEGAGQGSVKEVDRLLQSGELDGAERMLLNLLRKNPDDADLKARMARLSLALTQIYATQGRWGDAEDRLKRGRAMYPGDKAWRARLLFLGHIRAMGAEERKAWIQFLG